MPPPPPPTYSDRAIFKDFSLSFKSEGLCLKDYLAFSLDALDQNEAALRAREGEGGYGQSTRANSRLWFSSLDFPKISSK